MELTQLKYFVKLAEELNFTEAARKLFITQSTLSLSIKKLEEECGTPFFDRIGKCNYLTDAGKIFVEFAKRAIKEAETGITQIKEMKGIYTGKLRIGVVYSLHDIINNCIIPFTERYPEAYLSIVESNSVRDLADSVINGDIDLALTYRQKTMSHLLECHPLFEKPLSVIANKNHPVVSHNRLHLRELCKYPFIFFPYGIHTRMLIEQMFAENRLPMLSPHVEVNDASLILKMVETGKWLTILSEGIVNNWPNLKAIPIAEAAQNLCGCIIRPKDKHRSLLESEISDIICQHWNEK
ncbi:MAG: LysR family transcriptional regulator [Muribaculaceae bacterium]|jgi:LysR family transcriptional regulator, cyn operon transcriptional activator|nr:LysR family transcriptional regulator [Muribaculaceae bacterium]